MVLGRVFLGGCFLPLVVVAGVDADGNVAPFSPLFVGGAEDMTFRKGVADGRITGKGDNIEVLDIVGRPMLVVSVGAFTEVTPDKLRDAAGNVCAYLRKHPKMGDQVAINVTECTYSYKGWSLTAADLVGLYNVGFGLRNDSVQRSEKLRAKERDLLPLCFLCNGSLEEVNRSIEQTDKLIELAKWARRLGNMRGDECTPTVFINEVSTLLEQLGDKITVERLDREFYVRERFGAFLAVNKGSPHEPAGILAYYNCGVAGALTISLIGKSVTFDSGGLSLKPEDHMLRMYQDKMGGVNDVALFVYLVSIGVPFNIVLMVNATENMIAPDSTKPSTIITTRGGRLIEDRNTDAEGRLTLDDGIDYVTERYKPDINMDDATLTGHAIQALGGRIALFTTDECNELQPEMHALVKQAGFLAWPMPIPREHQPLMDFDECDGTNVDLKKTMGSGTAALYLGAAQSTANDRVGCNTILEHRDIAGAMRHEGTKGWRLSGASVDPLLALAFALPRRKDLQPRPVTAA